MKLPFIFKNNKDGRTNHHHHHPWQWPLCRQTNTLSFRAGQEIFKTVNSVFSDENEPRFVIPESWFTSSSELSHTTDEDNSDEPPLDPSTIRGLIKSERLFFEPGNTRSLMKEPKKTDESINGVALAMESADPYGDFRRSMEEMVESHGLSDWEFLGELLSWYLKMNGKINHGFIIGAFVDLLIGIAVIPKTSSDSSTSYVSAASSFDEET